MTPLNVHPEALTDIMVNILAGLLLFAFIFTGRGRQLSRWEGGLLLALYVGYLVLLLMQ